jgi:hypothetical protein
MSRAKPGLAELQRMAIDYAENVLRTVSFPIVEDGFQSEAVLDTMMQELVHAWAVGYKAGTER